VKKANPHIFIDIYHLRKKVYELLFDKTTLPAIFDLLEMFPIKIHGRALLCK